MTDVRISPGSQRFTASLVMLVAVSLSCAEGFGFDRHYGNGHSRGLFRAFNGQNSGHGWWGPAARPESVIPQPKRFYDSTGRWTGDGVDTMASNPPAWRRCD